MRSLIFASPLMIMTAGSLLVLMLGLWIRHNGVLLTTSIFTLATSLLVFLQIAGNSATDAFNGLIVHDPFSAFFTVFAIVVTGFSLIVSFQSKQIRLDRRSEFYSIMLAICTGLIFMANSNHLLMIYLSLETVSILSYTLAGFNREKSGSVEASMKYVVYGAMASAIMVFGMSFIFGSTGEMTLTGIREYFAQTPPEEIPHVLWLGVLLSFAGIGYKISAAPMHMWTPDVYEGAPTPVSAFLSVAPKAIGLALLIRFFVVGFSLPIEGETVAVQTGNNPAESAFHIIGPFNWPKFLMISSIFTMFLGNLAALGQSSVKRILAYSSIAHAGYMLMGLSSQNQLGLTAVLFYVLLYCTMNLGAFWVAALVEDSKGSDSLSSFRGLSKRKPWHSFFMLIFLFSLVGLPPFAGFIGKFYLFSAVLAREMYGLALFAAVNSAISLYYYMKIGKAIYLEAEEVAPKAGNSAIDSLAPLLLIGMLALPNLLLIVHWESVLAFAEKAIVLFVG